MSNIQDKVMWSLWMMFIVLFTALVMMAPLALIVGYVEIFTWVFNIT